MHTNQHYIHAAKMEKLYDGKMRCRLKINLTVTHRNQRDISTIDDPIEGEKKKLKIVL